jgi:rhamnose transport system permease protein
MSADRRKFLKRAEAAGLLARIVGSWGRARSAVTAGTLAGTVLGVVLLGAIGPALTFLGVSAYWERAIQGAIILVAVAADALPRIRHTHAALREARA